MKYIKLILLFAFLLSILFMPTMMQAEVMNKQWHVQSVDTMKVSRDKAREMKDVEMTERIFEEHVKRVASTGATHIAIGTPYDEEFIPVLEMWVKTARKFKLKVWFRGNFSGWEGWFSYPKINRTQHAQKIDSFIKENASLFEDGDIFTACPECENGGPGDPRHNKDVEGHREFLVQENMLMRQTFRKIGKKVTFNYNSMNGDVARLVMDEETTKALGGIVTIDHYVLEPQQLKRDIDSIAQRSGGNVMIGEIGSPIPDIHGRQTQEEQAAWLEETLSLLSTHPKIVGINYWVESGGTTELYTETGKKKLATDTLTRFYKGEAMEVTILNESKQPLGEVIVKGLRHTRVSDVTGKVGLPYLKPGQKVEFIHDGYTSATLSSTQNGKNVTIMLSAKETPFWENLPFDLEFRWPF